MITGELKNRIDGLWDVFAAGGLVNPLDVIEQVTYLMFIRDLDDTDNLRGVLKNRLVHTKQIHVLRLTVTADHIGNISVVYGINELRMVGMSATHRSVNDYIYRFAEVTSHYL